MSSHGTCPCGKPADKTSSGQPECWKCWNFRKLDGPAARHWVDVSEQFLSNVDTYDQMKFMPKTLGIDVEDFYKALTVAAQINRGCEWLIAEHKPIGSCVV